jgi:class 3 adenylate cyclase
LSRRIVFTLRRSDGTEYHAIEGEDGQRFISIEDMQIPIAPGDSIIRSNRFGASQSFTVKRVAHGKDSTMRWDRRNIYVTMDPSRGPSKQAPSGTTTILFADIVESTTLTGQWGDLAFREKARDLDQRLRDAVLRYGGIPIEGVNVGDGLLACFPAAHQGISAACECRTVAQAGGLQLRIGLHSGDVIAEGNSIYGGSVNIAARIAGMAAPDEVWISDTVRVLALTSSGVTLDDRGVRQLKGVGEPMRLWAAVSHPVTDAC